MCKKFLPRRKDMSEASYLSRAQHWAAILISQGSRGPGDLENSMRRVSRRWNIPYRTLWALRYRAPKDILASTYFRLHAAYTAECERQLQALKHDIETTKEIAGPDHAALRAAEALAYPQED